MASVLPAPPAAASGGAPRPPHQPSSLPQSSTAASSSNAQNAGPHLLSLKVMRASAPSLAVSEKPYYEHHAESTDALLSAVGQGIEQGLAHDLHSNRWDGASGSASNFPISDLLVLPNSFGTLYLGETFRTYLCVRNEAATAVREPSLRVEMQVGASDVQQSDAGRWHQLAHVILPAPTRLSPDPDGGEEGRPVWELAPGQPLETALGYDIKDLGAHVLVCTVGYKAAVQQGSEVAWVERSFRKYYKFSVERSPISVRTKVHQPRHASSLHHPDAKVRQRVELEVQVQNVAGNGSALVFEGLALKPAPGWGWASVDRPSLNGGGEEDMWARKVGTEVLADGDVRQYLFTLTPSTAATLAHETLKAGLDLGTSADGHAIRGDALGHLDISWRMSLGEPGRLQTSQLVRRCVVTPPITAPSSSSSSAKLAPRLSAQFTLQPSALETLRDVRPGSVVELGVDVAVCDVSTLVLPESVAEEEEDDDTPLSEIASSPRAKRTALAEGVTIRRTLRLAMQHCTVEPRAHTAAAASGSESGPEAPSTPRKTPVPSRTATPTQAVGALNKARLQANLTSLVRGGSLSLRPARASVDAEPPRSSTPLPPLPSKHELAPAAPVDDSEAVARKRLLDPVLRWTHVTEQYTAYTETHAQALTRPHPAPSVPHTLLPSPTALPLGPSLTPLPAIHLHLQRSPTPTAHAAEHTTTAHLTWAVDDAVPPYDMVRFGGVRLVLLSYTDEGESEVECMTSVHEVCVLAEALVGPH
ncbi:uncharacterized protein SRS1_14732 [Sporisorium reilianum f. sp. reilianum]|uniref:Trafficking protein particle complex subunit 13 n=1 Tax=Sporisorium reilianum f. sp. reilianum TaxID=72559 RepID=A0A2N8UGI9_9BASI|nr:uncharacterized protein SRS1_14732 [Sporisorium reilianum f. sp. reilianum]